MEEKKWITTEQMLEGLKNDPGNEQEYTRLLSGLLRATHWIIYDSQRELFGDSTDWKRYSWYTETEFLEFFGRGWWRRDA